jgi:hypothetical protein
MYLGETYQCCRRGCRRRDVPRGFISKYFLAEKSTSDGAAAMISVISKKNEVSAWLGRERVDGLDG